MSRTASVAARARMQGTFWATLAVTPRMRMSACSAVRDGAKGSRSSYVRSICCISSPGTPSVSNMALSLRLAAAAVLLRLLDGLGELDFLDHPLVQMPFQRLLIHALGHDGVLVERV